MDEPTNEHTVRAKELEQQGAYWEAGEEFKNALLDLNKQSGNKDEKAFCKRKIREMNLKRAEEFQEITGEYKFTEEDRKRLGEFIDSCTELETLADSLIRIGIHPNFQPKYEDITSSAQTNMPVTFVLANLSSQDKEGNLERDGHDAFALSYAQNYSIQQHLILDLYLIPVIQKLMETTMDFNNLSEYFHATGLFSENMLNTFDVGLERFTAHDYVSSLHILVPLFEKTFMDFTTALGEVDTVAARNQSGSSDQVWTQDRTLGEEFLKDEKVREIWGEDFCEQINFVFFAPLGYKIRHKIAHGYMPFGEFNLASNSLVLYFFLVIAARVSKVSKSSSK